MTAKEVRGIDRENSTASSRANQLTAADLNTLEACFALLENGEDGRNHDDELDAFDRLLTRLRGSEDRP